jgi:hypothetical protein
MRHSTIFIVAMLLLTAACKKTLDETGATTRTVANPTNPAELSCVELLQPQNGATNVILPIQFRWSSTCKKDSFRFLLVKNLGYDNTSFDTLVNTVTRDTTLLYAPPYYEESISYQWKVKNLSQKDTNLWSRVYNFTPPDARDSIIGEYHNIKRTRFNYQYPYLTKTPAGTGNVRFSKSTTLNGGIVAEEIGNPQSITEMTKSNNYTFDIYPYGAFPATGHVSQLYLGPHRDSFSVYVVTKRDDSAFAVEGYFFNGRFR